MAIIRRKINDGNGNLLFPEKIEKVVPVNAHFELCKKTAEWVLKRSGVHVVLFDYQSTATGEFPDCLSFDGDLSSLYEIKISRADFLSDKIKDCRKAYKFRYSRNYYWEHRIKDVVMERKRREHFSYKTIVEYKMEYSHLGCNRYYVCPAGLISPEERGINEFIHYGRSSFWVAREKMQFQIDLKPRHGWPLLFLAILICMAAGAGVTWYIALYTTPRYEKHKQEMNDAVEETKAMKSWNKKQRGQKK